MGEVLVTGSLYEIRAQYKRVLTRSDQSAPAALANSDEILIRPPRNQFSGRLASRRFRGDVAINKEPSKIFRYRE